MRYKPVHEASLAPPMATTMSGGGYEPPLPSPKAPDCARLIFNAVITSVDADVLATATLGEVYDVLLFGVPPTQTIQVVKRSSGQRLGAIVDRWSELRHCLEQGVVFEAELQTVSAPVRARLRPAPLIP